MAQHPQHRLDDPRMVRTGRGVHLEPIAKSGLSPLFLFARNGALDLSPAAEGTWHRPTFTHLSGLLEPFQIADKPIWPRWINSYAYHLPSLRS